MKFGSRMDVFLPAERVLAVKVGDRVVRRRYGDCRAAHGEATVSDPRDVPSRLSMLRRCGARRHPHARRLRRGAYLLPSAFTMANLFCGYACIVHAMHREFHTAALFIGIAIVLDMLDGRIARMTGTTSAFGLEFDSLADVVSFGVAPADAVVRLGPAAAGTPGLGRRVPVRGRGGRAAGALQHPVGQHRTSATSSACPARRPPVCRRPPCSRSRPGFSGPWEAAAVLTIVIVPALLMVSTIRFRSFKTLDLQTRRSSPVLFLLALGLAALAAQPEIVLLVLAYGYLSSAFVGLAWSAGAGGRTRRVPIGGRPTAPAPDARARQ